MDSYIEQIKQRILDNCESLRQVKLRKNRTINSINKHMSSNGFKYYEFLDNASLITEITSLIEDTELKKRFLDALAEIRGLDFKNLITIYNSPEVKAKKSAFLRTLRDVTNEFQNAKFYKNPEAFTSELDKVGKDIVIIDSYYEKFLRRNGFSEKDILELMGYISKCNMSLYKEKIQVQNEKELELQRKLVEKNKSKQEKQRKKYLMANKKSEFAEELLKKVEELINTDFGAEEDYDLNLVNAYKDLVIDLVINKFPIKEDMQQILIYIICQQYMEIKELMSLYTESELKEKLEFLNDAYNSYKKCVTKQDVVYQDSEEEKTKENDINVYYLYDEEGNNQFFNCLSNEKGDESFINGAKSIVEKIGKGIYEKGKKRPIDGIDNCFFVQQAKTFVSFIMLNEKNYIVLSASKFSDLNYLTEHIYINCLDQIDDIKKKVAGDIK